MNLKLNIFKRKYPDQEDSNNSKTLQDTFYQPNNFNLSQKIKSNTNFYLKIKYNPYHEGPLYQIQLNFPIHNLLIQNQEANSDSKEEKSNNNNTELNAKVIV